MFWIGCIFKLRFSSSGLDKHLLWYKIRLLYRYVGGFSGMLKIQHANWTVCVRLGLRHGRCCIDAGEDLDHWSVQSHPPPSGYQPATRVAIIIRRCFKTSRCGYAHLIWQSASKICQQSDPLPLILWPHFVGSLGTKKKLTTGDGENSSCNQYVSDGTNWGQQI